MSRFRCENCDHVYDEELGDPREGYPAGTRWEALPDDWFCPDCAVREKPDFVAVDGVSGSARSDVPSG